MDNTIRWGFIGCGAVTEKSSGPSFSRVSGSAIQAIMRRDLRKAEQSAKSLGAPRWYDSIDELISDPCVDAIYIATPPGLHREQALACCKARKPIYVEKPFARSFEEANEIVRAFEVASIPLFVAHYRRALPRFLELKKIVESGEIGEVRDVHVRLTRRFEDDEGHPWMFKPELSGGGKFFDIAPHTIDLLVFLFGSFASVASEVRASGAGGSLEEVVAVCFQTDRKVVGTCNFNFVSDTKGDELLIFGSSGSIRANVHGDKPMTVKGRAGAREVDIRNPPLIEESMISEVVRYLRGEEAMPCFGSEALETCRIIDQILWRFYEGRSGEFWRRPVYHAS